MVGTTVGMSLGVVELPAPGAGAGAAAPVPDGVDVVGNVLGSALLEVRDVVGWDCPGATPPPSIALHAGSREPCVQVIGREDVGCWPGIGATPPPPFGAAHEGSVEPGAHVVG